mmetsp:Transcript_3023/g.9073  ORF Transcript_3023/g.9073 Transcript_3023/m.9073 type:complete len:237 (-) Transcript_3023:281-991(-)
MMVQCPQVQHLQHAVVIDEQRPLDRLVSGKDTLVPQPKRQRIRCSRSREVRNGRVLRRMEDLVLERLGRDGDLEAFGLNWVPKHVRDHGPLDGSVVEIGDLMEHLVEPAVDGFRREAGELTRHLLHCMDCPHLVEGGQARLIYTVLDVLVESGLQCIGIRDVRLPLCAIKDGSLLSLRARALTRQQSEGGEVASILARRAAAEATAITLRRFERREKRLAHKASSPPLSLDDRPER